MRKKIDMQLLIKWPNLISYSKLQEYFATVLLLTLTPLAGWRPDIIKSNITFEAGPSFVRKNER